MAGVSEVELVAEQIAAGPTAQKGDRVLYSARLFLRRGDEVTADYASIAAYGDRLPTRQVNDLTLIEHTTTLGKRQAIAGVERILTGMSAGSYREAVIPPHLAYGKKGLGKQIPADAMLRVMVWVHAVQPG